MRLAVLGTVFLLAAVTPAWAQPYTVNHEVSRISFAGTHAGNDFSGTFDTWGAIIDFDPAAPEKTVIQADIDMKSARTGNNMFDGTLPNEDWFNATTHPRGKFISKTVSVNPDGSYQVEGDLTLRGITKPVSFAFTIDQPDAPVVSASAKFAINRLDFDIGKKSDANAEWVSQDITLTIKITANRDG